MVWWLSKEKDTAQDDGMVEDDAVEENTNDNNTTNNKGGEKLGDVEAMDGTDSEDNETKTAKGTFDGHEEFDDHHLEEEDIDHRNKNANEITDLNEIPFDLRIWNFAATFVQLGQAVALFFLSV